MRTRGQIGPFPKSPRFPKIQFSQNRPKRPIGHTSPGFPMPEFSPPPRYPAISPRETIPKSNEGAISPNCRTTKRQIPNQRHPAQMSPTDQHPSHSSHAFAANQSRLSIAPHCRDMSPAFLAHLADMQTKPIRHANDLSLNRRSNAIYRAARTLSLHTDTPQALPHLRIRQPPPHTPPSHFFPNPPHASLPRQSRQLATAPPEHSGHTSRHPADQPYQPHTPYLHPAPSLTDTLHTAPLHPIQQHP